MESGVTSSGAMERLTSVFALVGVGRSSLPTGLLADLPTGLLADLPSPFAFHRASVEHYPDLSRESDTLAETRPLDSRSSA
jgi:hypothetical protein